MPDDMLKDAIETSRRIIGEVEDFETQGKQAPDFSALVSSTTAPLCLASKNLPSPISGLACAEQIKTEFDAKWTPHWHCVIGRNFGSFVTHETKNFIFFYLGDKAIMLFKAG
jgi:hypothetical protein